MINQDLFHFDYVMLSCFCCVVSDGQYLNTNDIFHTGKTLLIMSYRDLSKMVIRIYIGF